MTTASVIRTSPVPAASARPGRAGVVIVSAGAVPPPSDTVIVNGTMIEADRAEPAGSVPSIAGPTAPWARATSTGLGAGSLSIRSRGAGWLTGGGAGRG